MNSERQYLAIDLKSFYASVECVERGINPLDACLVVADASRTEKTICLAVSPALKAYGIPGRPRLFEVTQLVRQINCQRGRRGRSTSKQCLDANRDLAVDYIIAQPRMQLYVDYSTRIFDIYMRHVSAEDVHVYSIDEVFIDVTPYLDTYRCTAHELAMRMIRDVLAETGITATAGIGTNLYLAKIAMDIVAKKMPPDKDGVRIAELDELSYRQQLWSHRPLTDFWRVGRGIARRLERARLFTMGDIARCSLTHEDWLYREFGVNAELLIDHAWGWEPVTIDLIKAYRPETRSMSSGQVLSEPYTFDKALTAVSEMAEEVALELVDKRLVTHRITLTVGYDVTSLTDPTISSRYNGRISTDHYGRQVPYHAHGTTGFENPTSSGSVITQEVIGLYRRIVNPILLVRRLTLSVEHIIPERLIKSRQVRQLDLFTDYEACRAAEKELSRERRRMEAINALRHRFGKNAILKGINYADGATQRERHQQIGGHKA